MSEPEAVTRARQWIPLHRENRYQKEAAKIMTRLLSAYDELAASVRERETVAYRQGYTDREKERDYDPGNPLSRKPPRTPGRDLPLTYRD